MTTFNTGNPIGSTDARDRSDNSENLDLAVNSLSPTFVDRLGVTRDTLEGIYQKSAYYRAGTFDAGYTLTNNRQTLAYGNVEYSWSGAFPKVVTAGSTPATSGGVGIDAWVDRTESTLRSSLLNEYGAHLVGNAAFYVDDILSVDASNIPNRAVIISRTRNGYTLGGGIFEYSSASAITVDNGLIFAPVIGSGRLIRKGYSVFGFVGDLLPEYYGAVGDGITNDTTAFQAALNSFSVGGVLRASEKYYVTALTVPHHVTIKGDFHNPGTDTNNTSAPYGTLRSAIKLASSGTITLNGSAAIVGMLVHRYGQIFPETAPETNFAGTAITINGDDTSVKDSMILGFNTAYYSNGFSRPNMSGVRIDCLNGVKITNCADVARINNVHCWPYLTIPTSANLTRSGIGFNFYTKCDLGVVTGCLAFGYLNGFKCDSVNGMMFVNCDAEHIGGASSVGYNIIGGSTHTTLLSCATYWCNIQVYINTNAVSNLPTFINNCILGGASVTGSVGVEIIAGDVSVNSGEISGVTDGVYVGNANSNVILDGGLIFRSLVGGYYPIFASVSTSKIQDKSSVWVDAPVAYSKTNNTNVGTTSVASAATLNLPSNLDGLIQVTGSVNITTGISAGWANRQITLAFASGLTVTHGGGAGTSLVKLSGNANATFAAGGTLTLRHSGNIWYEISRSS